MLLRRAAAGHLAGVQRERDAPAARRPLGVRDQLARRQQRVGVADVDRRAGRGVEHLDVPEGRHQHAAAVGVQRGEARRGPGRCAGDAVLGTMLGAAGAVVGAAARNATCEPRSAVAVNEIMRPSRLTLWQPPHASGLVGDDGTMNGDACEAPNGRRYVVPPGAGRGPVVEAARHRLGREAHVDRGRSKDRAARAVGALDRRLQRGVRVRVGDRQPAARRHRVEAGRQRAGDVEVVVRRGRRPAGSGTRGSRRRRASTET